MSSWKNALKITTVTQSELKNTGDQMTVQAKLGTRTFMTTRYEQLFDLYSKIKIRWIKVSVANARIALFRPGDAPEIAQLAGGNEAVYINWDSTGQLDAVSQGNLNDRILRSAAGTRRLYTYARKPLNFVWKIPSAYRKPICMSEFGKEFAAGADTTSMVASLEKLLEGKLRHIPQWGYFGIHDFIYDTSTTKGKFTVELTYSMGVTLLGFKLLNPKSVLYSNHQVTDLDTDIQLNDLLTDNVYSDDSDDEEISDTPKHKLKLNNDDISSSEDSYSDTDSDSDY